MTKSTDQASGVVGGTLDISTNTSTLGEQEPAQATDAGTVLAHRKHAALRAQKAAERSEQRHAAEADPSPSEP